MANLLAAFMQYAIVPLVKNKKKTWLIHFQLPPQNQICTKPFLARDRI